MNFGHVAVPSNIQPPRPRDIGRFSQLAHNVKSEEVTVIDTKTITIKQFYYDGAGPGKTYRIVLTVS